ncbi:hypothetical protein EV702DRAFT_1051139 [Suillus placidus]|uniref:Uncharacterized protein n=1 Tax=Suillus placidus TaxID=48579 RepID=A0A9P6ZGI5_9AGAM|nr:hypothetical protein EV702DRAFT_1051139 [Suillus placidus]
MLPVTCVPPADSFCQYLQIIDYDFMPSALHFWMASTHNIPVSSVRGVFGVIADCLGIAVEGDVSTRSIGRVLQEADVAANVQMVDEMMKHEVNHTSKTQLQGWKDVLHDMCNMYNTCMAGEKAVVDPREVVSKVKGMLTDHAEDQKKLVCLFSDWKRTCEREVRALLWQTIEGVMVAAGGIEAWEALTAGEQHLRSSEALLQLKLTIGQEKFDGLTKSAKESVDFFIWAGVLHAQGPQCSAALGGSSSAQARALHVSQRGAAKALALAGTVFHHKDDKKGQQDSIRFFLEAHLGYFLPWPDTSNTRYHSNCDGACEWIMHEDLYVIYLGIVMDKKEARMHTNIEQNVFAAFHCNKTKQELVCFGAWGQCISHPYFHSVHNSSDNILNLRPLHNRLIAHVRTLIDNTELVFGADATYETATLDRRQFEQPEAFYAIQWIAQDTERYPYLCPLFTAFLKVALETLLRFCHEFAPDGTIAWLSPEKWELAQMNSTNDVNEDWDLHEDISGPNCTKILAEEGPHQQYCRDGEETKDCTVQRNCKKDQKKKECREAAAVKLAAVVPRLTQEDINKMHVTELDLQIRWHRQFDSQIPAAKDLEGKKAPEQRAILAAAAERLSNGEVGPNTDKAAMMQEIEGHDTTNVGALLGDSDEENDS